LQLAAKLSIFFVGPPQLRGRLHVADQVSTEVLLGNYYSRHRCFAARDEYDTGLVCSRVGSDQQWFREEFSQSEENITGFMFIEASHPWPACGT
jgi:hypothetical protein